MEKQHSHAHGCTHCACDNPVLRILKDDIFSDRNLAEMKSGARQTTSSQPQTLMISGGIIRPMIGGSTDTVDAIGIAGGNVVVTGTQSSVAAYMTQNYPGYDTKELTGTQTLLPGLIEPHVHIVPTAMMTGWIDVSPFNGQDLLSTYDLTSVGSIINSNLPKIPGYIILGKGLDPSLMPFVQVNGETELQTIDNTALDAINSKKSMMLLSASMHTLYLNTKALNYVYDNSATVQGQYASAAAYISATNGQLEEETMMSPALAVVKTQITAMAAKVNSYLTELFQLANSRGVTFMYDAAMTSQFQNLLTTYLGNNAALVRIGAAQLCSSQADANALAINMPALDYQPVYYGHVKLVSDGSNQGLTGYQSTAYLCDPPSNMGIFNFPQSGIGHATVPPDYETLVATVIGKGWPLMIHANGDLAVTFAIDAYQNALTSGSTMRNRIEHCSLITTGQLTTMQQYGISPSFLIGHVGYWGYAFSEVIFSAKAQMLDLCNSALSAGMRITLHSDNEVSPLGPLRMMEQSITRIMEENTTSIEVLNAAESITPEQALVAVTYDAAWQCCADNWVGQLNTNYFADFVILAQDPLSLTTQSKQYMQMRNIQVLETWLGGVQVYTPG